MTKQIQDDMVVGLAYTLRLDDGQVVDQSSVAEPLEYLHGHAQIIEGLEEALEGLRVGDRRQVTVSPEEGYGEYVPDMELQFDRSEFPPHLVPEVGLALYLRDESGQQFPYWITKIEADTVILDPNHPLAGQNLHFDVEVVSVRPATAEELSHGHVHGAHSHD